MIFLARVCGAVGRGKGKGGEEREGGRGERKKIPESPLYE